MGVIVDQQMATIIEHPSQVRRIFAIRVPEFERDRLRAQPGEVARTTGLVVPQDRGGGIHPK